MPAPPHPSLPHRRKLALTTVAILALLLPLVVAPPAQAARFEDVPSDNVFVADVDRLAAARVTLGCSGPAAGRFCPDDDVTRQQMAAFLVRALDLPDADEQFRDVAADNIFARDIGALADAGITRGCNPPDNDQFCPGDTVTRQQMAAFLVRAGLAPDPAAGVPGITRGATAASEDGSEDAPTLRAPSPDAPTLRGPFAFDPDDDEPLSHLGQDVISGNDPTTFTSLTYLGRVDESFWQFDERFYEVQPDAFVFLADYDDGTTVRLIAHPSYGDRATARTKVERYAAADLGRLPILLRRNIGRLTIQPGDGGAIALPSRGIHLTEGTAEFRDGQQRLEELLFHEAVHTAFTDVWSFQRSSTWLTAQVLDGRWATTYARQNPDQEDVAESMLAAFGYLHRADRLRDRDREVIRTRIPNRVAEISVLFPPGQDWLRGG